jgi:hypothetical protein
VESGGIRRNPADSTDSGGVRPDSVQKAKKQHKYTSLTSIPNPNPNLNPNPNQTLTKTLTGGSHAVAGVRWNPVESGGFRWTPASKPTKICRTPVESAGFHRIPPESTGVHGVRRSPVDYVGECKVLLCGMSKSLDEA